MCDLLLTDAILSTLDTRIAHIIIIKRYFHEIYQPIHTSTTVLRPPGLCSGLPG